MTAFPTSTCGQDWRSLQAAAARQAYSAELCSAV
nr:MAG TPA: hypothetical protein [Caudoviricetes sp.]